VGLHAIKLQNLPVRIFLSIHHRLDHNAGAPGVILRLAEEYRRLGHEVRVHSFDDMPDSLRGNAGQVAFPWFCGVRLFGEARQVDVLDTVLR
jgi:hypothetical protein